MKVKINKSRVIRVILLILAGSLLFQFVKERISLISYDTQIVQYDREIAEQKLSNEELQDLLDRGNDLDYIEYIAREQHGMAYPGERVYYDLSEEEE